LVARHTQQDSFVAKSAQAGFIARLRKQINRQTGTCLKSNLRATKQTKLDQCENNRNLHFALKSRKSCFVKCYLWTL